MRLWKQLARPSAAVRALQRSGLCPCHRLGPCWALPPRVTWALPAHAGAETENQQIGYQRKNCTPLQFYHKCKISSHLWQILLQFFVYVLQYPAQSSSMELHKKVIWLSILIGIVTLYTTHPMSHRKKTNTHGHSHADKTKFSLPKCCHMEERQLHQGQKTRLIFAVTQYHCANKNFNRSRQLGDQYSAQWIRSKTGLCR